MTQFFYDLEKLSSVEEIKTSFMNVFNNQCITVGKPIEHKNTLFSIKLLEAELHLFGNSAIQLPSARALVVTCGDKVFKRHWHTCEDFMFLINKFATRPPKLLVNISNEPKRINRAVFFFSYSKVAYNPICRSLARQCCYHITIGIRKALQELHSYGFAHMDVRLPNICFDANYCPVLIDLTNCLYLDTREGPTSGRMYK